MLRVHCVQLFHDLRDPGVEDVLYEVGVGAAVRGTAADRFAAGEGLSALWLLAFGILLELAQLLFVVGRSGELLLALVAPLSVWGFDRAYWRMSKFQRTYAEIYALAARTDGALTVHFPHHRDGDDARELCIRDYPTAAIRINTATGGIEDN